MGEVVDRSEEMGGASENVVKDGSVDCRFHGVPRLSVAEAFHRPGFRTRTNC